MRRSTLIISLAIATTLGCAEQATVLGDGALVEPDLAGKADISDRVDVKGLVKYDEAVQGEITEDFEFHGYVLKAEPGARVTLEITHKGSSASFDTTLFVYGPRTTGYGSSSIVRDNDDGWGKLSKIDDFVLNEGGQYLVVVGTANALGRGRYRLLVTCPGENCAPATQDVPTDSCPNDIEDNLLECVSDTRSDLEVTRDAALSICLDEIDVVDLYEGLCHEDAWTTPPDWCAAGLDAFSEGYLPTCTTKLTDEIAGQDSPLSLQTLALGDELDAIQEQAWDACDDYCKLTISAFTYEEEDPSIVTVVDALRSLVEFEEADWTNRGESTAAEVQGVADGLELGDVLTPSRALAGSDTFEVGLGNYSDTPWPSVDAYGSIYGLHFPETKTLIVFDYVGFSE